MTIGEVKKLLKGLQEGHEGDDNLRRMTMVEMVMGEAKLMDDTQTLTQAGLSPDVALHVLFTVIRICSSDFVGTEGWFWG